MKFIRTVKRVGFDEDFWAKDYVFESKDFNLSEKFGETYAVDLATGRIHSGDNIKKLED